MYYKEIFSDLEPIKIPLYFLYLDTIFDGQILFTLKRYNCKILLLLLLLFCKTLTAGASGHTSHIFYCLHLYLLYVGFYFLALVRLFSQA